MQFIRYIPNALTVSRFLISFLLILDALNGQAGNTFVWLFIVGAFTDFLDGLIARKFNLATVTGAILDGYADMIFYISVLISVWLLFPRVILNNLFIITGLVIMQIISWVFSYAKFHRITSYHAYTAKIWGLALFVSFALLFAFSNDSLLIPMFVIAAISISEDILITGILPCWKSDIKHLIMAIKIRDNHLKYK